MSVSEEEGRSESTSRGESASVSRHRTLWGDPEAMETMARQQHYEELCERLSGLWMLPPDRLSPAEQGLLLEELRRLALDSARPAVMAAYACADAGEVQLALQVPSDRLSEAAQRILRSRLARLA